MLIAPAGYGKTTLAEQWVVRDGRVGVWFTARSSSTDVAALALGIARAATKLIDDCDHRLREHLRALPAPAENVQTLAEILSEDLAAWPENAWLVLDDYHEVTPEPKAEDFIEALVALSPVQFLIASRVRPRWVASKEVLYGEVLEITQSALTMNAHEAAAVLVDRTGPSTTGLVALAKGWPAVIGLASVSSAEVGPEIDQVPESLYRFFADEVFSALDPDVQRGLTTLSVAPVLDRELAVALLGSADADSVCSSALDVGLFVERDGRLELHPLARVFLDERGRTLGLVSDDVAARTCFTSYRAHKDWDAAFELVARVGLLGELPDLISAALDELLDTGRLSTLEKWCELAVRTGVQAPITALARAEVAFRRGHYVEAVAYAESAAIAEAISYRALSVAGRAAHLASREVDALNLFRRAEQVAATDEEARDARWGQLACSIDLELPDAARVLDQLSDGVSFGDVRAVVRMAGHRIYLQLRAGALALDDADTAYQLLDAVGDPIVEASFLSGYAIALALAARYDDAAKAAESLRLRADRYRLDFTVPYALCASATALTGLRAWSQAEDAAVDALARAEASRDVHAELLSRSILIRLFTQRGRIQSALDVYVNKSGGALNASIAEAVSSRALAIACAGRFDDALELVEEVRDTTRAIEPAVLIPAVEAVCALRSGEPDGLDRVANLGRIGFATGAVDLLVTSYRACPELLSVLLRAPDSRAFRELVERVGDGDLATAAGHPIATRDDRRLLLSPREREVFELLRNGLTNRQIAKILFIEESTVKVHAHHIYDKLGVRSRSALTVQAALERAAHATSAIEPTPSGDGSS